MTKVLEESQKNGHIPVLLKEIIEGFELFKSTPSVKYFDGTFGRGGHYKALKLFFDEKLTATVMDQDQQAILFANENFKTEVQNLKLKIIAANFSDFSEHVHDKFDMMLLDLGVSSPQLDQPTRGFSFYAEGPLDMRMNQSHGLTASDVIQDCSEQELNEIFQKYGEVRKPYRVTRALVHDRKTTRFETTKQLAGLIERVDGWKKKGVHPATQYFMALRIHVNQELSVLEQNLPLMIDALNPSGRLAVITFHSLEDRIVKNIFRNSNQGKPVNKKVIIADEIEEKNNARARSAKLRFFEKASI
jgi:16S rRNA (cytosine1402-N4)-methyltransferase